MVVGVIDHQTGTRDIRLIPPLGAGWLPTKAVVVAGGGVDGRRSAARRVHGQGGGLRRVRRRPVLAGSVVVLAGIVAGSALTCATACGSSGA